MAATPVDDHTEEFEQLAGLSALDVLEGEEFERFERHAAHCERCQLMVRLDREAVAGLSLTAPEMEPSTDFKARLMQRAAQELAQRATGGLGAGGTAGRASSSTDPPRGEAPSERAPDSEVTSPRTAEVEHAPTRTSDRDASIAAPTPMRPADTSAPTPPRAGDERSRRAPSAEQASVPAPLRPPDNVVPIWRRRSPWLNAIAAVLVLAAVSVGAYSYEQQPIATVQIGTDGGGSATVIIRRSGAAELDLRGLPDPGPGLLYEAWIIPPGKQPVAAGIASSGNTSIPLEQDPRGTTVAVTRERTRVDAPTSPPFMAGEVRT